MVKERVTPDPEIAAMTKVNAALANLDGEVLANVVAWINRRYGNPSVGENAAERIARQQRAERGEPTARSVPPIP